MATIASSVTVGWASASQRHRLPTITMTAAATITDQPKCSDGIAANWLAALSIAPLYGDGPNTLPVSTMPMSDSRRGGASG